MADFFSRIFAIPSDDESYSADDTRSQSSSIQRHTTSPRKNDRKHGSKSRSSRKSSTPDHSIDKYEIDDSSNSISLDEDGRHLRSDKKDQRGRQRRNDEPSGHSSASEPRKEKKKRSSSERPDTIHSNSKHSQQSRYRSARSLSKVSERHVSAQIISPPSSDDHGVDETQKKIKSWRSKFSAGMKKHLSPSSASSSPPLPSKQVKKSKSEKSNNVPKDTPPQPINVGDFITISQQYLEENADMSVLTLPRELHNKEVDEENLMQIVGQKGVLGNNAVQAFLDRRSAGVDKKGGDVYIQQSTSVESKGMYERVGSYATKMLDISYSQSLDNNSTENVNGGPDLLVLANHQVGKHAWPCDPTAEGYTPAGTGSGSIGATAAASSTSVVTEQEIGSIGVPPPPSPSTLIEDNEQKSHKLPTNNNQVASYFIEKDTKNLESQDKPRPFDEPSSCPGELAPEKCNKSVSFCLPPPSSQPPAPPFLGPTLDYYYSMERPHQDQMPIWSNSTVLPPIIELWSSVEDGASSNRVSAWIREKENELLLEENAPLLLSDGIIVEVDGVENNVQKEILSSPKSHVREPVTNPTSPGEKSIDYLNDILDCNDDEDDAPLDEKEGLKVVPAATSSLSIHTDPAMSSESHLTGEDASFRHRSQWKSPHNMTYRPPMFNQAGVQKDANLLKVGKSESSEDSVLHLRRLHGDDTQYQDSNRPIILHGRVIRHGNMPSIARSPSASSYVSTSSCNAKTFAAIVIQASARGMLERQSFMIMINSVLVIQPAVRRFLFRQRYLAHIKLKRSYFPSKWQRKVANDTHTCR